MNEKATIFNYVRLCKETKDCDKCVLGSKNNERGVPCENLIRSCPDDANEIILDWCKTHPVKTRQSEFLKHYPNARMSDGVIDICPQNFDTTFICTDEMVCKDCLKGYWSKEVKENV